MPHNLYSWLACSSGARVSYDTHCCRHHHRLHFGLLRSWRLEWGMYHKPLLRADCYLKQTDLSDKCCAVYSFMKPTLLWKAPIIEIVMRDSLWAQCVYREPILCWAASLWSWPSSSLSLPCSDVDLNITGKGSRLIPSVCQFAHVYVNPKVACFLKVMYYICVVVFSQAILIQLVACFECSGNKRFSW